jgi:hypothetical protein
MNTQNQNPLTEDSPQQSLNTSIVMLEYLAGTLPIKQQPQTAQEGDEPPKYLNAGEVAGLRHCGIVFIAFVVCLRMLMSICCSRLHSRRDDRFFIWACW